jgi:hypothetical protein
LKDIGIGLDAHAAVAARWARLARDVSADESPRLQPRDPTTIISSAAVLAAVGALGGWLRAYRASRIDPA